MSKKKAGAIVFAAVLIIFWVFIGFIAYVKPVYKYVSGLIRVEGLINTGRYKKAVGYIDIMIKEHPDNDSLFKRKGYALICDDRNEEAIEVLIKAMNMDPADAVIINNISWAYNNLEQYGKALTNSREAISMDPGLDTAWVNHGNALYGLFRYDEALKAYDNALKLSPQYADVYYSRGLAYINLDKYDEALQDFYKYSELNSSDKDVLEYIAQCLYYQGKYNESLEKLERLLENDPDNVFAHLYKGYNLVQESKYEDAVKSYERVIELSPDYSNGYLCKGEALYYSGKYEEAVENFSKAIDIDNSNSDAYVWQAKYYIATKDFSRAIALCNKALSHKKDSAFALSTIANAYYRQGKYDEALNYAEKAISADNGYMDAYTAKASVLYNQGEYSECLEFTNKALDQFPGTSELLWYRADSYSYLGYHKKALYDYEAALLDYPQDENLLMSLGWEHYYQQNYSNSEDYVKKVFKINEKNQEAAMLEKALEETKLPQAQRIVNFVKANYFYLSQVKGFDKKSKLFIAKEDLSYQDIEDYLKSIKLDKDEFTFFIYGGEYNRIVREEYENHLESRILRPDIYYIKFTDFTSNIGAEFIKEINNLYKPEEKTLVIDLRGNSGGVLSAANDILDYLLPKSTTGSLVFRNGSREPFYSDAEQKRLKKIIVMVDENSASSSEFLTLSLRKQLNNVAVIGHPTFGKGVGQATFEDKKKGYMILLTSFVWDVRGQNIVGSRINPDIVVKGNSDEDYFNEVFRQADK